MGYHYRHYHFELPTTTTGWIAWLAAIVFIAVVFPRPHRRYSSFRDGNFDSNSMFHLFGLPQMMVGARRPQEDPNDPKSVSFRTKVFGVMASLQVRETKDASWKVSALIEGSRKFFVAVKDAMARGDLPRLECLMHSELYKIYKYAVSNGALPPVGGSFNLERVDIVHFEDQPGEEYDRFTVRIEATRAQNLATTPGTSMSVNRNVVEYWTFARERRAWRLYRMESADHYETRVS